MSKLYYLYKGQNATTGNPNPITGNMSMYGEIISFSSKEKRDKFHAEYYNQNNPSEYTEKCNKRTARQFNLGMSVRNFDDYMTEVVAYNVDENYNSYFGVSE